jgi:hypothetical protein
MTYGEPPDPPATARLLDVLRRAASPDRAISCAAAEPDRA